MRRAIRKKGAKFPKEFEGPAGVARLYRYEFKPGRRLSFAVYHKIGQRKPGRKTFADQRLAKKFAASILRKPAGVSRVFRYDYKSRHRVEYRVYYKIGRRKSHYGHFANYGAAREFVAEIIGKGAASSKFKV